MARLDSLSADPIRKVMVFGGPKSGKTRKVGELAKHKKLIWFDLERGFNTLFQLPKEVQANIELIHIPDNKTTPMAIETMLKVIKGLKVSICEKHGKVTCPVCVKADLAAPGSAPSITVELNALDGSHCVVVDSSTQMVQSALANITKAQPADYKLERDDWGNLKNLMETFYGYIQAAPFNVVCISHEDEVTLVDKSIKLVPVGGSSKFSRNTAKYFDDIVYARVVNGKHTFVSSTGSDNQVLTGSRANIDLGKMPDANLIVLWGEQK